MIHRLAVSAVLLGLTPVLACGSGGDTTPGSFLVDFPTVAAGVAVIKSTTGVTVSAYLTGPTGSVSGVDGDACEGLLNQILTGMVTTKPVTSTPSPVSPCDLLQGKGSLPVAYGSYAFVAVAEAASSAGESASKTILLVGCAEQTISATNTEVVIPMTLVNESRSVPATSCTSLEQACPSGGSC